MILIANDQTVSVDLRDANAEVVALADVRLRVEDLAGAAVEGLESLELEFDDETGLWTVELPAELTGLVAGRQYVRILRVTLPDREVPSVEIRDVVKSQIRTSAH